VNALLLAAVLLAAPGSSADVGISGVSLTPATAPAPVAAPALAPEASAATARVELSASRAFAGDGLPARSPSEAGMSAERLAVIDRIVSRGILAGGYPGASVVVGRKGYSVYQKGFGHLEWTNQSQTVSPTETIYDLASLTKVVATTTAAMILWEEGRLRLDAPVAAYIPEFTGGEKNRVTVRQLLTHQSGLPAGRNLWRIARTPAEARKAVIETSLARKPGTRVVYSDLGMDMLAFVVETAAGEKLDTFLEKRVYGPLGMTNTFFRPARTLVTRIAPTEVSPPRGYRIRGEVHDENAFALGGVAGHAGLFSTAADLSVFAQMMLNGGEYNGVRIVADSTVKLFTRRTAETRALGWDTADGQGGSGQFLSSRAFGHTGFTGTSIWIDPEREMFVVLLTNRVHAPRAPRPATVIMDVRHDLADAAALAVVDQPDLFRPMLTSFRSDRREGWNPPTRRRRGS
jgi:CubicO group peptidase (beta-lactamase class C family)